MVHHQARFEEGDCVEARFRGGSRWHPARIIKVQRDETYKLEFDEGQSEEGVRPE
jgi:hypothetical protein